MAKKPITGVRIEREPDRPGPVFAINAVDGLAHAVVKGRDSEEFASLLAAAPALLAACEAFLERGPTNSVKAAIKRAVAEAAQPPPPFVDSPRTVNGANDWAPRVTLQQQWDDAAGALHDAAHRLVEIQETISERATDVLDDDDGTKAEAREADAEPITDLDLPNVREVAEAAEDCTIPDWAVTP